VDLVTATNGAEAYLKAQTERPDLVILDVVMPHMTGFEVCARIRQTDGLREVPVLLVTTRGEQANIEKGYASGCSDYITKPLNNVEFVTKVKEFLPR
jgi:CheY-like chemotaxis protein